MPNIVLTRKAAVTMGALVGFLKPKLAADAQIDWGSLLGNVTAKNFKSKKTALLAAVKQQVKGKLAKDANIEGLAQLLDALEAEAPAEAGAPGALETDPSTGELGEQAPPKQAPPMKAVGGEKEDADDLGGEEPPGGGNTDQLAAFLQSKGMAPEDIQKACQMVGGGGGLDDISGLGAEKDAEKMAAAKDEDYDVNSTTGTGTTGAKVENVAKDQPPGFKGMPKVGGGQEDDMVSKHAMDEAIKDAAKQAIKQANDANTAAIKAAVEQERKTQRDIREAENVVRPWVGVLAMAYDSAEEIYRTALTALGVKIEGVHPSAYRTILELQPTPNQKKRVDYNGAADSAGGLNSSDFAKRNPGAARIDVL